MAKQLINYNRETLRLRRSFLFLSGTLFLASFIPSAKIGVVDLLNITDQNNNDYEKLVFIIFAICLFKAIYYFFLLISDTYMNHRHSFSRTFTQGMRTPEISAPRLPSTLNADDPNILKLLIDLYEKLIRDRHDLLDNKVGFHLGEFKKRAQEFDSFYKNESKNSKILHYGFMWGMPYLFFLTSTFYSFALIKIGGYEFLKFTTPL